jgi:vancomycin resistance protein YoaR
MARFNGIIIQPGEEFSFNENLGPVDASAGYVPELVIKSFGTIPEYGGGLCQVSSTMYRAALFSGLEITERSNHSYAVGYYAQVLGHGLDATIYPGVKDLKFKNNTDSPIVVNSYAEGTSAYFKFYGSKKIDRVELVGPINSNYRYPGPQSVKVDPSLPAGTVKVMDTPVTGFNSYWERVIYDKDNNKTVEEIFSNYRAVNSKLVVSPDYYQSTETPEQNAEESATEA